MTTLEMMQSGTRAADETAEAPMGHEAEAALERIAAGAYAQVEPGSDALGRRIHEVARTLESTAMDNLQGVVGIAVTCGSAMTAVAEMMRDAREVNNRAQAIAAAAEEMVASVNEIARTSEAATADAAEAREAAHKGTDAAERAVSTMENIARAVEGAAAQVDSLAEASAQIGEIVGSIEAIAKQTNLLALNATIEAARAGEAGKGFAVVAGEVKNLANQTAKATDDIRHRIENLRAEMGTIVSSMQNGAEAVQQGREVIVETGEGMRIITAQVEGITTRMQEVAEILGQQSEASGEVAEGVSTIAQMSDHNVTAISDIATAMDTAHGKIRERLDAICTADITHKVVVVAKADHVAFKKTIMDTMIGRGSTRAEDVASHQTCRLGKWYYEVKDPAIRNDSAFKALEDPHRRVHAAGKAVLERLAAGDLEASLAEARRMEDASEEVLDLLDTLLANLRG